MKYILIIGDGMADNPIDELCGQTPLEAAEKPLIDALAAAGELGTVRTVPEGVPPGSDTAILSIFGYDPRVCYTGRSPLEAAGSGVQMEPGDVSYRCNMVTLGGDGDSFADKTILSHSGGSVEGDESIELITFLQNDPQFSVAAVKAHMTFHASPSFRHIAVQKNADIRGLKAAPPHDHLGSVIGTLLPKGCPNAQTLTELMEIAHCKLDEHPVNQKRRAEGKLPANGIWFWAEGTVVALSSFTQRYRRTGAVVSAVPLVWGIGALGGLDVLHVRGATGELDTNYKGKVDACVNSLLAGGDFCCIHIEAPDECTHAGDLEGKLQAVSRIDSRVFRPLTARLNELSFDYRILFLSDHKTLLSTRGHDGDPVPYMIYDSRRNSGCGLPYTEKSGKTGTWIENGTELMGRFLED